MGDGIESGMRFGRLEVIELIGKNKTHNKIYLCLCDCGKKTKPVGSRLKNGRARSCGCLQRDTAKSHGKSKSKMYKTYQSMKCRCNTKNTPYFKNYGGRGIKVCESWLGRNGFMNFISDMGDKPSPDYSLERIDNEKGYSPENCIWATRKQQQRNRRGNRMIEIDGEIKTLMEWCNLSKTKYSTAHYRLGKGMNPKSALNMS